MELFDVHTHQGNLTNTIYNLKPNLIPPDSGNYSAGLHPWFLDANWKNKLEEIIKLADDQRFLAIGEAGFDRLRGPEIVLQKEAFAAQAELSYRLGIPLILHCVKGHDLLLEFLKSSSKIPNIIWHGFNQKIHLAEQLLEFPVYFSFGKALLQPESNASQWLKACPLHRIFFETDDSSLNIHSIFNAASLILGLSVNQLQHQVVYNWNKISNRKIHE
ncbi:TatD family hydrolase [Algoriphagus sp. CAU 1675]|uniref:TatD family hydrolase n=1 Tax=Algoriphagus sp. CAU 1675 TaxID=3032597 RepID=UPI0023DCB9A7|nr:TatD family hydrolase [Algoriphagus sp. CAU 1675]MDF2156544.1 TatD family hydrolase [Algoriphagus sp. CAU 1675]